MQEEAHPVLTFVSSLPLNMAMSLVPSFPVAFHPALFLHAGNSPTLFPGCLRGECHIHYSIRVQHTVLTLQRGSETCVCLSSLFSGIPGAFCAYLCALPCTGKCNGDGGGAVCCRGCSSRLWYLSACGRSTAGLPSPLPSAKSHSPTLLSL